MTIEVLTDERGSSGAGLIALERRLAHLRSLVDRDPVRRDQVLRLYVRGQALRAMALGRTGGVEAASTAKLLRTELEFDIELQMASLRGAEAMLDGDATRRFLYAPGMRIAGGTSEIQRNIIAERVLGLPREPVRPPEAGQSWPRWRRSARRAAYTAASVRRCMPSLVSRLDT